jgi:hypothetical protein
MGGKNTHEATPESDDKSPVKKLVELDQSSPWPQFKEVMKKKLDGQQGVCHGMCTTWISCGLDLGRNSDFAQLYRDEDKKLVEEIVERQRQWQANKLIIFKASEALKREQTELTKLGEAHKDYKSKLAVLNQKIRDHNAKQQKILGSCCDGGKLEDTKKGEGSALCDDLKSLLVHKKNAYLMLALVTTGYGGHGVAFHVLDSGKVLFMDPNTYLYEIKSIDQCNTFFKEHYKKQSFKKYDKYTCYFWGLGI